MRLRHSGGRCGRYHGARAGLCHSTAERILVGVGKSCELSDSDEAVLFQECAQLSKTVLFRYADGREPFEVFVTHAPQRMRRPKPNCVQNKPNCDQSKAVPRARPRAFQPNGKHCRDDEAGAYSVPDCGPFGFKLNPRNHQGDVELAQLA